MRYQSEEEKYILSIRKYLSELAKVGGQKKLVLTFCLLFGVVGTIIMLLGVFFAIHWVIGIIVTVLGIGFIAWKALYSNFKDGQGD